MSEFKGRTYADVRVWYVDGGGQLKPSKKGLTVSPDIWPEFVAGIERLGAELAERGLLQEVEEEAAE